MCQNGEGCGASVWIPAYGDFYVTSGYYLRAYLKTMRVGRELPFDKLRANVFFSEPVCGEHSSERILR